MKVSYFYLLRKPLGPLASYPVMFLSILQVLIGNGPNQWIMWIAVIQQRAN